MLFSKRLCVNTTTTTTERQAYISVRRRRFYEGKKVIITMRKNSFFSYVKMFQNMYIIIYTCKFRIAVSPHVHVVLTRKSQDFNGGVENVSDLKVVFTRKKMHIILFSGSHLSFGVKRRRSQLTKIIIIPMNSRDN